MPLEHCIRKTFVKSTRWLPDDVHLSVNLRKIQSDKLQRKNYHVFIILHIVWYRDCSVLNLLNGPLRKQ